MASGSSPGVPPGGAFYGWLPATAWRPAKASGPPPADMTALESGWLCPQRLFAGPVLPQALQASLSCRRQLSAACHHSCHPGGLPAAVADQHHHCGTACTTAGLHGGDDLEAGPPSAPGTATGPLVESDAAGSPGKSC